MVLKRGNGKETEVMEMEIRKVDGTYIVVTSYDAFVAGPYEWLAQAMTAYPNCCTQGSGVTEITLLARA